MSSFVGYWGAHPASPATVGNSHRGCRSKRLRRQVEAVTESDLATIGIWSYGLAAAGFLAFAARLIIGWRPGHARRPVARGHDGHRALGLRGFRGLVSPRLRRVGCLDRCRCAALCDLVPVSRRAAAGRTHRLERAPRGGHAEMGRGDCCRRFGRLCARALCAARDGCRGDGGPYDRLRPPARPCNLRAHPGRTTDTACRAVSAMGAEAAVCRSRRRIRLRSVLLCGCHAVQPHRCRNLGRARCGQCAGHSLHRGRHRTQSCVDDRDAPVAWGGVSLDRGSSFRRVSAAGRRRRLHRKVPGWRMGPGAADRDILPGASCRHSRRVVGQISLAAARLRQQAFLLLPLRLPRGMAAVHTDIGRRHARAGGPAAVDSRARQPGGKPRGRALASRGGAGLSSAGALEHAGNGGYRVDGGFAAAFPGAHRLGGRPCRIRGGSCPLRRVGAPGMAPEIAVCMARGAADDRRGTGRVRGAGEIACNH